MTSMAMERPLFLIHDASGFVDYAAAMEQHLGPSVKVCALGVTLGNTQPATIEGIARVLSDVITARQPQGPYRIAGWALGGLLAYEVAAQLIGDDRSIEFIGVLLADSRKSYVDPLTDRHPFPRELFQAWLGFSANLQSASSAAVLYDDAEGPALPELISAALASCDVDSSDSDRELFRELCTRARRYAEASATYQVERSSVPVHVFASHDVLRTVEGIQDELWVSQLTNAQVRISEEGTEMDGSGAAYWAAAAAFLTEGLHDAERRGALFTEVNTGPLVLVQSGNQSDCPVVFIPGAGDSVSAILPVASELHDRAVFAVQHRGVDGCHMPYRSVEASARACLPEILVLADDAPVHLIGHSFGGWVAFEIARHLKRVRRQVASLTIIDSEAPPFEHEYTTEEVLTEWIAMLELAIGKPLEINIKSVLRYPLNKRLNLVHDRIAKAGLVPTRSSSDMLRGPLCAFAAALRCRYVPDGGYEGPLRLLVVADSRLDTYANKQRRQSAIDGWRSLAPNLDACVGPGNHITILKPPHSRWLANWWEAGVASTPTALPRIAVR
jgi:thioesterase domain-containing protein